MHEIRADDEVRARLGTALRRLGHAIVGHEASVEDLGALATRLAEAAESLEAGADRRRDPVSLGAESLVQPLDGTLTAGYPDRPFSGPSSPLGLDMHVQRDGDEVIADFTLHAAHEGAPGRSHGGIVAGAFDDVLGFVLSLERVIAFTGELTIRYVAPIPLHTPLQIRARLEGHDGRKLWIVGDLLHDGTVIATARGLFIEPRVLPF